MAVPQRLNTDQLVRNIEKSQIGHSTTLLGPYGRKPGEYRILNYRLLQYHDLRVGTCLHEVLPTMRIHIQ